MSTGYKWLIVILLVLSAILRLSGLAHESLGNDELSSCYRSSFSSLSTVFSRGVFPDVHPPAFHIVIFFVENTIGDSSTALRIPSAVAGILAVYALFLVGRRLFSPSVGFLAAFLMAVSPVHIWYSQEARSYSILILLVTLSIYQLVRLFDGMDRRGRIRTRESLTFIALCILMEYVHYFGLLMVLLETGAFLLYCIFRRRVNRQTLMTALLPAIAFIPWIPVAMKQSGSGSYITHPDIRSLQSLLFEYMSWSGIMMAVMAASLVSVLVLILSGKRDLRQYSTRSKLVLTGWLVLPVVCALIVSYALVPVLTNRNLLVILPAFFLLLSLLIHVLLKKDLFRIAAGFLLGLFLLFQLFFVREHYSAPHKSQFRETACYAATHANPETNTVVVASVWNEFYLDYYFRRNLSNLKVDVLATGVSDFDTVRTLIRQEVPDELWFIWAHREPETALIDSIEKYSCEMEYHGFVQAGLWRFTL